MAKSKKRGSEKKAKKKSKDKKERDEVKELLYELGNKLIGESGKKIIDMLYKKKNVNEFLIAKRTGLNINQVRNLLYKLSSKNIIFSIRKKARKKGWYIYYWTLYNDKALEFLRDTKIKRSREIENEIESKSTITFYSCSKGCVVMKEETALLHDFFCPECGELMHPVNMEGEIKKLNAEKEKLAREIDNINAVINQLKEKELKKIKPKVKPKAKAKGEIKVKVKAKARTKVRTKARMKKATKQKGKATKQSKSKKK
ncbi:MAG: hypothetical protein QXJ92_01105 [Candidatus Pacearchaeota archaeon]